jgi:hypothetical protein
MQIRTKTRGRSTSIHDETSEAVRRQIAAMGSAVFEIGLFKPDAAASEAVMLPRVWDQEALLRSVAWLRHQNRDGRNIYVRPKGEHNLNLVDDLSLESIAAMVQAGFAPALIVETSPGNYQAWVKHAEQLTKEEGTAAARALAERFGGDPRAADWRHFGRLAGFTNRKEKYRDPSRVCTHSSKSSKQVGRFTSKRSSSSARFVGNSRPSGNGKTNGGRARNRSMHGSR